MMSGLIGLRTSAAAAIRCACTSGVTSWAEPFGNHSRFQVVMRSLVGSGDSASAPAMTKDATKAKNARFTGPRLNSLSVREKDFSTSKYSRSLAFSASCQLGTGRPLQISSAKPVGVWAGSRPWIPKGRTLWIVDAHRDNGKRFVVRSDEMLSAFLELERITHELALSALLGAPDV